MHLPKSITKTLISVDQSFDLHDEKARISFSLLLKLPAPRIVHEGTGYVLHNNDLILHEAGTVTVPRTRVPGWNDEDGNPVTDWSYWARVTVEAEGRTTTVWEGNLVPEFARHELYPGHGSEFTQIRYADPIPGEA